MKKTGWFVALFVAVALLARLGYRVVAVGTRNQLQRRQCWKGPEPENNATTFQNCTTGTNDTGWLTIARNVDTVNSRVTFFDGAGAATTTPGDVWTVEVDLVLSDILRVGANNTQRLSVRLRERMIMRSRN